MENLGEKYLRVFNELVENIPSIRFAKKEMEFAYGINIIKNEKILGHLSFADRSFVILHYGDTREFLGFTSINDENCYTLKNHFYKMVGYLGKEIVAEVFGELGKLRQTVLSINDVLPEGLKADTPEKICENLVLHFENAPETTGYEEAKDHFESLKS
nr:hypothetical protein K-LCC10_0144 [Kaumoebavirus]